MDQERVHFHRKPSNALTKYHLFQIKSKAIDKLHYAAICIISKCSNVSNVSRFCHKILSSIYPTVQMRLIGSFPSPGFQAFSHSKLLAGAKCEFCISQINRAPVLESRYVYANTCIRSIHCFIQLLRTFPLQKRM